jgi:2-polyprenyl-3-methyl-5-hydroxy-6-metoxy-1,4-benzoquinol methylase
VDLKEVDILGDTIADHWYYQSKARAITRLVAERNPRRVLDVGAGSGFFAQHLLAHTAATEAYCVDISYDTEYRTELEGKAIHFLRSTGPLEADVALLMDVLEHVDDDVGLLREYAQKVPASCAFVITVPAFNFLWSEHDEFLEHRRRYTLSHLKQVVTQAGLQVQHGLYYFAGILPAAMLVRALRSRVRRGSPPRSHLTRQSPLVNQLLSGICQAELGIMNFNRLAGLSVVCLAMKN